MNTLTMNTLKSVGFFVCLLLVSRLIPHPPNFTPLIAGIIFLPFILEDKRFVIIIPMIVMLISDFIIGFHNHMFWTYGAFLLISLGVLGYFQKKVNANLLFNGECLEAWTILRAKYHKIVNMYTVKSFLQLFHWLLTVISVHFTAYRARF